ncbi:MAG: hypothetical protein J6Y53_03565 [Alphaproteobacteria bacterium]|nr:hypothetical protein [Alphaproteobacteria bacterium]
MKKEKKRKEEELSIIASGDMERIKGAIRDYAFTVGTQMRLLLPENIEILKLYVSMRKPCRDCVCAILLGDYDKKIVDNAVMANCLDEQNEVLLVKRYPNLVTRYCRTNPAGPYLHEGAYFEALKNERLAKVVRPYPQQGASLKLGDMFTPEMLKKLGYC